MRDKLINELKYYVNFELEDKTLKQLLIMYNLIFNKDYALEQELPKKKNSSYRWDN